jgi:hypothetical protein
MNREAAAVQALPWRPLSPAALGDLAHDLRGCIHVIRGHAELLRAEAADQHSHESAAYIVDASRVLGGLCEDVVDFLRLPELPVAEPVMLQVVAPEESENPIWVHPGVARVVTHVLEHAARTATADVTVTAASRSAATYGIWVSPVTVNGAQRDGVVALATELLAAHGGDLLISGGRMELLVPIMSEAH